MKNYQTFARIGSGLTAIGALCWLLWPHDIQQLNNPEAIFIFFVALITWVFTEFKHSEEIGAQKPSENDVALARELLTFYSGVFRTLLKETDLWEFVPSSDYSEIRSFLNRWETGEAFFHNRSLQIKLNSLCRHLDELSMHVAQHTTPEMIAGSLKTGFKPYVIVTDEEHQRRRKESQIANELASKVWDELEEMIPYLRVIIA